MQLQFTAHFDTNQDKATHLFDIPTSSLNIHTLHYGCNVYHLHNALQQIAKAS